MRILVVLLGATLLTGCTSLAEPSLRVSPYLAVYQLRGKSSMTSFVDPMNTAGPVQSNPTQRMATFGQDRFREDVGIRADFGDGFGGIRADYYQLDMDTSRKGELNGDWGNLLEDDRVSMYANMDELRLGYVEPIAEFRTEYRDEEMRFQFGIGGVFTSRQMTMKALDETFTRFQNYELAGDTIAPTLRARVSWMKLALDVDYAAAPEALVLSGDIEGLSQDIEARLSYQLPQRDISFFVGLRYSEFSGSGVAGNFTYDSDLIIDGMQFGVRVTF